MVTILRGRTVPDFQLGTMGTSGRMLTAAKDEPVNQMNQSYKESG